MDTQTFSYYQRARKAGYDPRNALYVARTIRRWDAMDNDVRIVAYPEEESYFAVYGKEDTPERQKEMERILDSLGCWYVVGEIKNPDTDEWENIDGVGMCAGYEQPCDPYENAYVADIMNAVMDEVARRELAAFDAIPEAA